MTPTQAAVHHMLQRWYMADDLAQVAAMAEAAGVPIAGTRRLHLGAGPRFGEIEVIHHSTPGVGAGERGEGRGIVIDSAMSSSCGDGNEQRGWKHKTGGEWPGSRVMPTASHLGK